jgi:cleavage and polyadenylation specificity factor subunit 1
MFLYLCMFPLLFYSKSPVLASYTIDVKTLDEKIANVIDFQFLHGYFEPTLLIVYEPLMTWSG